ncbi:MAG: erythromycin esterase family protein, partial [Polyangiaceae bacterium]
MGPRARPPSELLPRSRGKHPLSPPARRSFSAPLTALLLTTALLSPLAAGCSTQRPPAQRLPMELLKNRHRRARRAATTGSLLGVVVGPDGAPLDFALVTAIPVTADPEDGQPPFLTTSLSRGKFELQGLPPGEYGLTVTAPAANASTPTSQNTPILAGSFAGVVSVQTRETGPPVFVRLAPQDLVLRGRVTTEDGSPLPGALVRAVRESPYLGDHFFAKTDNHGDFILGLPQGKYFLVGQAHGRRPARIDLPESPLPEALANLQVHLPPALEIPPEADLSAWVLSSGGVLSSPDAADTADLEKLAPLVGDARVVAFGEASYTAGEIARLKLRMFQKLVRELGFSALMIEASQADVRALDEHIVRGKGTLAAAIRGLGYFSLDTEETTELFAWMRAYNEDGRHRKKLRVFGVDVQRTATAATFVQAYLEKVDKALARSVETTLDRLRVPGLGADLRTRPEDEQEAFTSDVEAVARRMTKNRRVYIAKSNWSEYTHATEDIAALVWAVRVIRDERERAAAMADVAKRTLATLPPDTKVALFAHATQVSRRPEDRGMGALLAADLKKQYLPIGMTFYQGWIRAWDFTRDPGVDRGTKLFRLAPAEPGTLESLLAGAGASMFYADVRKA